MGDTTLSAEAARLVIIGAAGRKTLDSTTVTVPTSTPNGLPANNFRFSASTYDATRRYFLYVNDCASTSGVAAHCAPGTSGTVNATDVTLTVDLTSWGLPSSTVLVVNLVHTSSHGAVTALPALSNSGTITVSSPAGSTMLIVGPRVGRQTTTVLTAAADTTLTAGTGSASAAGGAATTLAVSTSATANHATTRVAMMSFVIPAIAAGTSLTAAVLELTLASAATAYMPLSVFGLACGARWAEATATWSNSGAIAINTSQPMNAAITSLTQARLGSSN